MAVDAGAVRKGRMVVMLWPIRLRAMGQQASLAEEQLESGVWPPRQVNRPIYVEEDGDSSAWPGLLRPKIALFQRPGAVF